MTWLLLDAGNTALKWALARPADARMLAHGILGLPVARPDDWAPLRRALREAGSDGPAAAVTAIGCSVAAEAVTRQVAAALAPMAPGGVRWCGPQPDFEFAGVRLVNGYRDPMQLGADRWHAMIAARQSFPAQPLVVVCAGTATTVDWVDAAGRFLGGLIAPGSALMAQSLAQGTARLPRSRGEVVAAPDNTDDAIATGAAEALAGLVERRVRALARRAGPPQLVLAGGRAGELAGRLALEGELAGTLLDERLVLRGLWYRASGGGADEPVPLRRAGGA